DLRVSARRRGQCPGKPSTAGPMGRSRIACSGGVWISPGCRLRRPGRCKGGQLSRQTEVLAPLAVGEWLPFDLVGRPEAESFAGEPSGGGVERLGGGGKPVGWMRIREEM